jgi:NADH-quinone oxidoreductase subunit E
MSPDLVRQIVERNNGAEAGLIGSLLEIQTKFGYLPAEALRTVAEATNRSLVDVYGVATFYRAFSLKPRGKHLISCCLGTACHVRGAPRIAEELQKQLGVAPGDTTPDDEFTFETVNCLGACALGPIVVVDGRYYSQTNTSMIAGILKETREARLPDLSADKRSILLPVACPHCNHGLLDPGHLIDGQPSIKITLSYGQKHGWLRLSRLYGSYFSESEHEIPLDEVVNVFCPHCNAELIGADYCPECGENMGAMRVIGGGTIQFCPKHGCKGHILDLQ